MTITRVVNTANLVSKSASAIANEPDEVDREIAHAFSRLSIQASLVSRVVPQEFYQNVEIGSTLSSHSASFHSVRDARDSLNSLIVQSLQPDDMNFNVEPTLGKAANQMIARYKLVAYLHQWTTKLDLMVNQISSVTVQDMDAIRLLRIQSIVAIIWNSTTLGGNESQFDNYKTHFGSIVSLASLIIDKSENSTSSQSSSRLSTPAATLDSFPSTTTLLPAGGLPTFLFALEAGIIFPLYFTAIKCRCPSIRRHATSLLLQVEPQRQGIWDARILGKTSEYIIQFEEAGSLVAVSCDANTWPPEEMRIHSAYNTSNQDMEKRVQEVRFMWRPGGSGGDWVDWSEKIYY